MPLFKKSPSDSGVLSERFLKALQKCRMLLLKVRVLLIKSLKNILDAFSDNFQRFNLISETLQNSTSEKVKKYIFWLVYPLTLIIFLYQ